MRIHIPSSLPVRSAPPRRTAPRLARFLLWLLLFTLHNSNFELQAQWSRDPAINTTVRQSSDVGVYLSDFVSVPDGSGGVFVIWAEQQKYLYGQHLDSNGVRQWPERGKLLNDTLMKYRERVSAIPDSSGGFIACWKEATMAIDSTSVRLKRWNRDGVVLWDKLLWEKRRSAVAQVPLAGDEHGGAYVLNGISNPSDGAQLQLQRIDSSGALPWGNAGIVVDSFSFYYDALIGDGSGGIFVSWGNGSEGNVNVQRVNSSGALLWGPEGVLLEPRQPHRQTLNSNLACDGKDGVIVSYITKNTTFHWYYPVTMQRLSPDGTRMWDSTGVAIDTFKTFTLTIDPHI